MFLLLHRIVHMYAQSKDSSSVGAAVRIAGPAVGLLRMPTAWLDFFSQCRNNPNSTNITGLLAGPAYWNIGSIMLTFRCATSSTGSGMNTSAKSAVAPLAVLAGGVAVVGPEPAAAEDILSSLS
jgi:hypothetical protein